MIYWTPKWKQHTILDGKREYLMTWSITSEAAALFCTRRQCREFIEKEWGYIRSRPDLQKEPHCWRVPTAVAVKIVEIKKDRRK